VKIPNPITYPMTISQRLNGVARGRSNVPTVRSRRKETPAIKKTKKKMKNPIRTGPKLSTNVDFPAPEGPCNQRFRNDLPVKICCSVLCSY
jgi:hypothetical protein